MQIKVLKCIYKPFLFNSTLILSLLLISSSYTYIQEQKREKKYTIKYSFGKTISNPQCKNIYIYICSKEIKNNVFIDFLFFFRVI